MANLREKLERTDAVIRSVNGDSCTTLGPSLRTIVETFRVALNKSVSEAIRAGLIGSHFPTVSVIDGTVLHFSEVDASGDGDDSIEGEDDVDPPADHAGI